MADSSTEGHEPQHDEDEITLDFGKIGGFLKRLGKDDEEKEKEEKGERKEKTGKDEGQKGHAGKPKEPKKEGKGVAYAPDEEEDEDGIALDFGAIGSKLKRLFAGGDKRGGKKADDAENAHDDEVSLDLSGAVSSFSRSGKWLIPLALVLAAVVLSVMLRMQPADLPATAAWGRQNIQGMIHDDIANAVYKQNPTLPQEYRERITDQQYGEALDAQQYTFRTGPYAGQTFDIQQQIRAATEAIKAQFKDTEGVTYLGDIDTWMHYRTVRNKVETGEFYDELRDGVPWDNHMVAPLGRKMEISLHHYVGYYFHRVFSAFNPGASVMRSFWFISILIAALAVIPAFFIARRLGGDLGGFFAAAIVALHPVFLGRTSGGIVDTDAYNVTIPLFIAWAFLEAFESEDLRKKIALAALSGIMVGVYSFAWIGWWYIFDFILATVGLFMVSEAARSLIKRGGLDTTDVLRRLRGPASLLATFFLVSGLSVSIIVGASTFKWFYQRPFAFTLIKEVALTKIWPNVYTTVAELNPASLDGVVNQISFGKPLFFYLSLVGIAITMLASQKRRIDMKYAIFLSIWYAGTMYASLKGMRFVMLLVPAFGISLGVFAGMSVFLLSRWLEGQFGLNRRLGKIILAAMVLLLLVAPFRSARSMARGELPMVNDGWYDAIARIGVESAPDAIINSWWDFGHWFKAIADRRVTFDGASQNTPMAHWIGRVLLTEDEDEAVGILRMLDCGSNTAFERLDSYLGDEVASVEALYRTVVLDREAARGVLEGLVTPEQADEVLAYTHCDAPENYLITSGDMVGKSGVWSHFGSWDMRRAAMYNLVRGKDISEGVAILTEQFGLPETEASRLYYEIQTEAANDWIAPWPSYWTSGGCKTEGALVTCQSQYISFTLNLTTGETVIPTQQGPRTFHSLAFVDSEKEFRVVKNTENLLDSSGTLFGVAVYGFPSPDKFIITTTRGSAPQPSADWLAGSMFSRLFYFNGYGLDHFELFDSRQGSMGPVITWKVDWDGGRMDAVKSGSMLWIDYLGWLENGTGVDSTIVGWEKMPLNTGLSFDDYETKPMPYIFGSGGLVPGFEKALVGMRQGEVKLVRIPPEEAYGTDPTAHPLGNQTLNFKVRVTKIA